MAGGSVMGAMGGMGGMPQMNQYGPAGGNGYNPMGGMGGMGTPGAVGAMQTYGNEAKQMIEVPKMIVGKIIGRGGETITMIQRKSGARAMVDQQVPEGAPCKVNITGTPQTVAACAQIIQEIMMGVPIAQAGASLPPPQQQQANPYGGGNQYGGGAYGGMGGMNGGMGGMQGGMQGMGMPQQQMMPQYGAYGAYGNPQMAQMQQQYAMGAGGYQAYGAGAAVGGMGAMGGMGGYGQQQGMPGQVPAAVPKPAAANPWTEHKTDEGVTYWYNSTTGVSQVSTTVSICPYLITFMHFS